MVDDIDPEDLGDTVEAMIWAATFDHYHGSTQEAWDVACDDVWAYRAERDRRKEEKE